MTMSWRLASRLSVVTLSLVVILIIAVFSLRSSGANGGSSSGQGQSSALSGLQGTDLGSIPAPDFRLRDQFGREVSLSQFKGMPVVITFLYTHCTDVCPQIADRLYATMLGLSKDAGRVAVLALSVDPAGDTQASALRFSNAHKMTRFWHFLLGSHEQLAPIWMEYNVDAQGAPAPGVAHFSTALYVIDKEGRERVLLDSDFTAQQLEDDLHVLLSE
jgi:protein SCO1/2